MVTSQQAAQADALIQQGRAQESYFFSTISSPDWIEPLVARGYFKKPPAVESVDDQLVYSRWPELMYLARMAAEVPELASRLLCDMDSTDNYLVHDDQVKLCLTLPAASAAPVVKVRLTEWLEPPTAFATPRRLAELAVRLGANGQPGQATAIVAALTALQPPVDSEDADGSRFDRGPTARVGARHADYAHVLDALNAGVGTATESSLRVMCDSLAAVLDEPNDDGWCRDIAQSSERRYETRAALLHVIARYGVLLGESAPESLTRVLAYLQDSDHRIFRRLRLELLGRFPEGHDEQIREALSDVQLINSCGGSFEFRRLVVAHLGALALADRQPYLEWLARDVDPERIREFRRFCGLPEPTDDEIRIDADIRLRNELHAVRNALPAEWQVRYDELVAKHGDAVAPRLEAEETVARSVADSSPYEPAELAGMSIADLRRMLADWQPPPGARIEEPTIGALARRLEESVSQRPGEISSNVMTFVDLDPSYVSAILSGLGKCIKDEQTINLPPVLDFCGWALSQQGAHQREGLSHPYEVPWVWAHGRVADLLQSLLRADPPILEDDKARTVLTLVLQLCGHESPRPEDEAGENRDYLSMAINSPRGKGLESLLRFLIWLHNVEQARSLSTQLEALRAEAWNALSNAADPSSNRSLSDRAILGSWFPNICALSEAWAQEHVEAVFPMEPMHSSLLAVTWRAFIVYTHPYSGVFKMLAARYAWASERLAEVADDEADTVEHLVQHLTLLYGRGAAAIDSDPITAFWKHASSKTRARAWSFTGHSIPKDKADIDEEAITRFQDLVESRLDFFESKDGAEGREELIALGVLLANELFEQSWSLDILGRVLRLTEGWLDRKGKVAERLARYGVEHLAAVIECLDLMGRATDDQWWVEDAAKSIKLMLGRGAASGVPAVQEQSERLQNYLVGVGHWTFRDLD